MFGTVPVDLLLNVARAKGCYTQLDLDLGDPAYFFLDPAYMTTLPRSIVRYNTKHQRSGSYSVVDHPSFSAMEDELLREGFLETDFPFKHKVARQFFLNNYLMLPGDEFPRAAYMASIKELVDNYNNGEIDQSVKNYR